MREPVPAQPCRRRQHKAHDDAPAELALPALAQECRLCQDVAHVDALG
ncbi:MAG: hypothetical protein M3Y65_23715 [Pseudomonadota bacterium]|nr:hypothetical protein [Pseudomonadota bacterium]